MNVIVWLVILKMALFSVILKAVVFPIGYIVLVKGNKKLFFKQALFGDIVNLILSIVLYHFFGLFGLGLAAVFNGVLFGIYIYLMVNKHYNFNFFSEGKRLVLINLFIGLVAIAIVYSFEQFYIYIFISILFIISALYSLKELNKRIDLRQFISDKINRRK